MNKELENVNSEIKDVIFEELTSTHEYWGENTLIEMIDFCNRNQLHSQKSILIKLLSPDRIKI